MDTTPDQVVGEDQAVQFLTALVPQNPGERTRAFAALLRSLNTGSDR
jgi:hypothetical protein